MKKEFVRDPYNYDSDKESQITGLACKDKSLTQQQFLEESNINYIADKYGLTGEMPQLPDGFMWGAEFDQIFDFQSAQNAIVAGDRAFMALPAKVRARFQNDPQKLFEFLEDVENEPEARKMGLLRPKTDLESTQGTPTPPKDPGHPIPPKDGVLGVPPNPKKDT